jgi:hypothetical protein
VVSPRDLVAIDVLNLSFPPTSTIATISGSYPADDVRRLHRPFEHHSNELPWRELIVTWDDPPGR